MALNFFRLHRSSKKNIDFENNSSERFYPTIIKPIIYIYIGNDAINNPYINFSTNFSDIRTYSIDLIKIENSDNDGVYVANNSSFIEFFVEVVNYYFNENFTTSNYSSNEDYRKEFFYNYLTYFDYRFSSSHNAIANISTIEPNMITTINSMPSINILSLNETTLTSKILYNIRIDVKDNIRVNEVTQDYDSKSTLLVSVNKFNLT